MSYKINENQGNCSVSVIPENDFYWQYIDGFLTLKSVASLFQFDKGNFQYTGEVKKKKTNYILIGCIFYSRL